MKTIAICSSIKNLDTVKHTIEGMKQLGIKGLFPNIDFQAEGPNLTLSEMHKLQKDHFEAIRSSDAIYVINPDRYIGTMVTTEIGFALGQNKPVYYSEASGRIELDALSAGVISLEKLQDLRNT